MKRQALGCAVLLLLAAPPRSARAEAEPREGEAARTPVAIDRLLQLPDSLDFGVERRGGATRSEWRARFDTAVADRDRAETALRAAQEKLGEVAGASDAWEFRPPGVGDAAPDAPLSYQIRQEIRRQESELARATARLRDLEVEANLAGVPADWRGATPEATTREPQPEPDPNPSDAAVPPEGDDP